jgi:hypothetical protein
MYSTEQLLQLRERSTFLQQNASQVYDSHHGSQGKITESSNISTEQKFLHFSAYSFVSSKYFFYFCVAVVSAAKFLCYKPFVILLWVETTFLNKVLVCCLKKTSHDKGKVFLGFISTCNYLDKVIEDRMDNTVLRTWDILSSALSILLLSVRAYLYSRCLPVYV